MNEGNLEFQGWPSITRDNPFMVEITEKIDGTNGCIIIENGEIVGVQSRKRFITPENDNFGFASWVVENAEELKKLGDGRHYGEWAGPKIQKNHHALTENTFFLFNTQTESKPDCCEIVPVIYEGLIDHDTVEKLLEELKQKYADIEGYEPEGIVVYYFAFKSRTKHTIKTPKGKWCKPNKEIV